MTRDFLIYCSTAPNFLKQQKQNSEKVKIAQPRPEPTVLAHRTSRTMEESTFEYLFSPRFSFITQQS